MVNYSCELCGKEFKQKGHYNKHLTRKTPCQNNNSNLIKKLVDDAINQKIDDIVKHNVLMSNGNTIISNNVIHDSVMSESTYGSSVKYTIHDNYSNLVEYFNTTLNTNTDLVKTSNDEPTPIECVEEMLSKIPEDKFKDSNMKWFDPCCGCGNFFVVLLNRLQPYHPVKHILENMLYFNDTNEDRIDIVKQVFCNDKYNLNITKLDFLQFESTIKYNFIVANPPYAKLLENGKRASKNHNMIGSFIKKSFELLEKGGYLVYITPDNWMSYADRNTLIQDITSKQLLYLNIHTAKKYFKKIGSSFTWYIIENVDSYKDIIIEGIYKKNSYISSVKSEIRRYIPLFYNELVQSILSKTTDNKTSVKFRVETSSDLHKYTKKMFISDVQTDVYKYKLHHTPTQQVWASKPHKYQHGYKVFIGTTSYYNVFVDNCGMTQSIAYIQCENEEQALNYACILKHPMYVFLNNICRWGNFNNIRILQSFPLCDDYTNVYKKFNITDDEITFIEANL